MITRHYVLLLSALGALLLVSCVISLGFGSARVPVDVVWRILLNKVFGLGVVDWSMGQEHIVWLIRVPRMMLGALVGAGLALIGAVLQAVTRNSLADPHLLGVTSGATLGAVIVVLHVGEIIGLLTLPLAAFIGALLSMLVVLAVASRNGRLESDRLLLCGVAVSFVMMAVANLLLFMGDHRAASAVMFWMLGGLGLARWELLAVPTATILLGWPCCWHGPCAQCPDGRRTDRRDPGPERTQRAAQGVPDCVADDRRAGVHQRLHRLCRADGAAHRPAPGGCRAPTLAAGMRAAGERVPGVGRCGRAHLDCSRRLADWRGHGSDRRVIFIGLMRKR